MSPLCHQHWIKQIYTHEIWVLVCDNTSHMVRKTGRKLKKSETNVAKSDARANTVVMNGLKNLSTKMKQNYWSWLTSTNVTQYGFVACTKLHILQGQACDSSTVCFYLITFVCYSHSPVIC